jgi:hypothetical protein
MCNKLTNLNEFILSINSHSKGEEWSGVEWSGVVWCGVVWRGEERRERERNRFLTIARIALF